jgi:type I restriction enzyme S subunit
MRQNMTQLIDAIGNNGMIVDGDWIESKDQDLNGNVRLIQLADIGDGVFLDKSRKFVTSNTVKRLRCTLLQKGDVLIARMPDPLGRACFFPGIGQSAITAVDICIIRTNENDIYPDWLVFYLNSQLVRLQIQNQAQGATRARVPTSKLKELCIHVPSIDDQRRIAARLKAQLAEVEKARKAAERQLNETSKLADSIILHSMRKNGTEKRLLAEVLEEVKTGIGEDWSKYPTLGATRNGMAPAKEPPGKIPQRYKPVFPGTVFYNPMRILIGSIAFVDDDDIPGITSPDYVVLKGKEHTVDSRWFYYWLRSSLGEQCINSLARGAVRERMLFNRLAEGEIELPSYNVQQIASKALVELKPMRKAIEQQMKEINLMPTKILSQAFEM